MQDDMEAQFVTINEDCFLVVGRHWISVHSILHVDLEYGGLVRIRLLDEHIELDKKESGAVKKLLQGTAMKESWEE